MNAARCILMSAALLLIAAPALADGSMIGWSEIYEETQLAFLDWDDGVEHLHILPKFRTRSGEFAWVVPTPSLPELAESELQIFRELGYLSASEHRRRDSFLDCDDHIYATYDNGGVEIIASQRIGPYETRILAADSGTVLADSLSGWGYLNPDRRDEVTAVLDDYVDRGWFFTAMRLEVDLSDPHSYYYGSVDPIRLTFTADEPVYPMAISRLSAASLTEVTLYTAADHRLTFPGAGTTYANRLSRDELQEIRSRYHTLGSQLSEGEFLTKLERTYRPVEMTEDLVLTRADSDAEYHRIIYSGLPVGAGLLMMTMAALKLRPSRRE